MRFTKIKSLGLTIFLFLALEAIILVGVGVFTASIGLNVITGRLVEEELSSTADLVQELLGCYSVGDYTLKDNDLYKGDLNLSKEMGFIDRVNAQSGLEITIFWGDTRKLTTIKEADGSRALNTKMSTDLYARICNGETVYKKNVSIEGAKYDAFYMPLKQPSNGEIVGVLFTGRSSADISSNKLSTLLKMMLFLVIDSFVWLVFCTYLIKMLKDCLQNICGYVKSVGDGDLTFEVIERYKLRSDELGQMAIACDNAKKYLSFVVSQLQSGSSKLSGNTLEFKTNFENSLTSIQGINSAVEEIAQSNTMQASDVQDVSSNLSVISADVDESLKSVKELEDSVAKMNEINKGVDEYLKKLRSVCDASAKEIEKLKEDTGNTNNSVLDIGKALEAIQSIASQTNLLALNASIEAARAGEHGRGFAVVAEEIRRLSEDSKASASEISEIINVLISNSQESIDRMVSVSDSSHMQEEQLGYVADAFEDLSKCIKAVSDVAEVVLSSVKEIETGKNGISGSVESLSALSEETAASTEETSASMQTLTSMIEACVGMVDSLAELSNGLSDASSKFKL